MSHRLVHRAKPPTDEGEIALFDQEDSLELEKLFFEKLGNEFIHHLIRTGFELQIFPILGEVMDHREKNLQIRPPDNIDRLFFLISSDYSLHDKTRQFEARCLSDSLLKNIGSLFKYGVYSMLGTKNVEELSESAIYQGSADWLSIRIQVNEIGENVSEILITLVILKSIPPQATLLCSLHRSLMSSDLQITRQLLLRAIAALPYFWSQSPAFIRLRAAKEAFQTKVRGNKQPDPQVIRKTDENRQIIQELLSHALKHDPKVTEMKSKNYFTLHTCKDTVPSDIFLDQLMSRFQPSHPADLFKVQPGQFVESPRCIQCNMRLNLEDLIEIFKFYDAQGITYYYNKYEAYFQTQPSADLSVLRKVMQSDLGEMAPLTKRNWEILEKREKQLMEEQLKVQKKANLHIEQNNGISKLEGDIKLIDKHYMDFMKMIKSRLYHKKETNIELLKDICVELLRLKEELRAKIAKMEKLKQ